MFKSPCLLKSQRKGREKNILNIDKVDESITDVALVLEINAKIEKIELAEMGLIDALQQHFLSWKKKHQIQSSDEAEE